MVFQEELRQKAEQQQNQQTGKRSFTTERTDAEVSEIIEELRIHQIELEIQNEELRQASDELEAARNRYADLYDLAPVGYFTLDLETTIIGVNLTGALMLGVNRNQLVGRKLTAFLDPGYQDLVFRCFRKCQNIGEQVACDLMLQKPGGASFYYHLEGSMMETAETSEVCYQIVLSDISTRHNAEIALRSSHDQWLRTFDSITDSVTILDSDMRISKANKACALLLKQPVSALTGRLCHEVFGKNNLVCNECPVKQVLQTGKPQTMEIVNDALQRTFQVSASPLLDENGQLAGVVQIAKDITRKKLLEKQLVQTQKMEAIGTLAGGIAHDFNNILTAIMGYANLGMLRLPGKDGDSISFSSEQNSKLKDYFYEIFTAGERAGKLVSQILSFSRQNEIVHQAIELAPIVKESIKFLRATLSATITIEQYIQAETPMVLADPTQIHQVMMNLCTNASHAMQDKGGTLRIELKQFDLSEKDASMYHDIDPGNYTELLIGDSGHGINRELQERMFDPFFTTKEQGDGTGLGLSVVHGIVTQIGGTIKVDSTLGKGSVFRILLPADKGFGGNSESSEKTANIPGGNEHILLVDDEEMLLEIGRKFLKYYGYRVTVCASATDALKLFNKHPYDFDLVVTDQVMPGMTGAQLIRELLKIRSDIPIFLTTGYSEVISEEKALAMGVSAFIMKPIIMDELATAIRETLDKE